MGTYKGFEVFEGRTDDGRRGWLAATPARSGYLGPYETEAEARSAVDTAMVAAIERSARAVADAKRHAELGR